MPGLRRTELYSNFPGGIKRTFFEKKTETVKKKIQRIDERVFCKIVPTKPRGPLTMKTKLPPGSWGSSLG